MKSNEKGYSMIELLVVLALIAIMLGMYFAYDMLNRQGRQSLHDLSRQFTRDFELLKQISMMENLPTRISLSQNTNSYRFFKYSTDTNSWENFTPKQTPRERKFGYRVDLMSDCDFAFDSNGLVVSPDTLSIGSKYTFNLTADGRVSKDIHTITIFPSGGIDVKKELN